MARPESQPFWLNDSFNGNSPVGPDEQSGLVDFEPPSSSQFSLDLAFDVEQYELPIQDLHSCLGPVYAQPDGMYGTALPFPIDNTRFPNPVDNYNFELDKGMDSSSANNCGAPSAAAQFLKIGRFNAEKMKGIPITSADMIVDSNAINLCDYWLQLYPNVYPKDADIHALSQLTGQPPASIERWLNNKIRSVSSSSHDSAIWSKSSTVSSAIPSETSPSREAALTDMTLPQIPHRDLNSGASGWGPAFTELDNRSRLVFEIPETWTTSPLVKKSLAEAAWSSRARSSCHPTSSISHLVRIPDKPLQCTRKCGYATAPKKDWKRHESNAFPQHGFLCTLPAAIRIGNATFCVYCPAERRQPNPTIAHMKSEHGFTFSADSDMEMTLCNQVCHRREHLKTHFGKIHPGIHPDAWVRIAAFDVKQSAFPKHCGFCRKTFTSWNERIDHIQVHFESDGLDMRKWQDFDDSDDHRRNKRHRRDDDADDKSDSGDSDQDDDGYFDKGNSGAGNGGNGKKHNTRTRQLRGDRSLQTPSHYHGTSSSDGDTVSEDEHIPVLDHVYGWLENISAPKDSSLAQETLDGHVHSSELHLDDSGQEILSNDETKHEQGKLAQKTHPTAVGWLIPLSAAVGMGHCGSGFNHTEQEMTRSALAFAEFESSVKKTKPNLWELSSIIAATDTAFTQFIIDALDECQIRDNLFIPRTMDWIFGYKTFERRAKDSQQSLCISGTGDYGKMSLCSQMARANFAFEAYFDFEKLPSPNRDENQKCMMDSTKLETTPLHLRKPLRSQGLATSRLAAAARTDDIVFVCDSGGGVLDKTTYEIKHSSSLGLKELLGAYNFGHHTSEDIVIAVMGVTGAGKSSIISDICSGTPGKFNIALRSSLSSKHDRPTDAPYQIR